MSNTSSNFEMTGILLWQELRKRKTPQEKIAIIQQTMEPGMTVSHVARLQVCCSNGKNNIWRAASPRWLPGKMLFPHRSWHLQ